MNGWYNNPMNARMNLWMACVPCYAFKWWPRSLCTEYFA